MSNQQPWLKPTALSLCSSTLLVLSSSLSLSCRPRHCCCFLLLPHFIFIFAVARQAVDVVAIISNPQHDVVCVLGPWQHAFLLFLVPVSSAVRLIVVGNLRFLRVKLISGIIERGAGGSLHVSPQKSDEEFSLSSKPHDVGTFVLLFRISTQRLRQKNSHIFLLLSPNSTPLDSQASAAPPFHPILSPNIATMNPE